MLPNKPTLHAGLYVVYKDDFTGITLLFKSEEGKKRFFEKWTEIRKLIEDCVHYEDNHPRLKGL